MNSNKKWKFTITKEVAAETSSFYSQLIGQTFIMKRGIHKFYHIDGAVCVKNGAGKELKIRIILFPEEIERIQRIYGVKMNEYLVPLRAKTLMTYL